MYILLLFIAFYLPFQLALNPAPGIDLASIRVLIIMVFLLWVARSLKHRNLFIPAIPLTGLLVVFLFFHLGSLLVAQNQEWAMRKILFLFSIVPLYFAASALLRSRDRALQVINALVISGTVAALVGIIQFLGQFVMGTDAVYAFWAEYVVVPFLGKSFSQAVLANPSWLVNVGGDTFLRATATFPDPHMFSFYLGLLIPFSAALFFRTKSKKRWWWLFSCGALIIADLLTFSRGGYVGLAAAAIVSLGMAKEAFYTNHWAKVAAVCGMLALIIVFTPVSKRFHSIVDVKEGSNRGRIETWEKAWEVLMRHPVRGVGIGNYPIEVKPAASYRDPIYAHNSYLDIAVETGMASALVWVIALGVAGYRLYKKAGYDKIFLAGAFSIIIFSLHSLVETATYSSHVLPLLMLIMSLSNGEVSEDNNFEDSAYE